VNVKSIVRRQEMVFVDGNHHKQVLSYDKLVPGSFYVAETEDRLYVYPSDSTDLSSRTVEVAIRPELLKLQTVRNVIVDGLVFQHASSELEGGAVFVADSKHVLLVDVTTRWNNWFGLRIWNDDNVTLRDITASRNGAGGMGIGKSRRLRIEDAVTSRNNWRGAQGGFRGWSIAGVKALFVHDVYITGLRSTSNSARGLWLDTDVTRVLIEDARVCNNRHDGVFLEAMQGPVVLKNSVICDNTGEGILTGNIAQFGLLDSRLCNNGASQILLSGLDKRVVTDHETGRVISIPHGRDWTITGTTIRGGKMLFGTTASRAAFDALADTLRSDANTWWHASVEQPFMIGGGHTVDFTGWQQTTSQDTNSAFHDPGGSC
jgi:hypothetical protein